MADRNTITRRLRADGFQLWHWFEDLWLAVSDGPARQEAALMTALSDAVGGRCSLLVFDVTEAAHTAGLVNADSSRWLSQVWHTALRSEAEPDRARELSTAGK